MVGDLGRSYLGTAMHVQLAKEKSCDTYGAKCMAYQHHEINSINRYILQIFGC